MALWHRKLPYCRSYDTKNDVVQLISRELTSRAALRENQVSPIVSSGPYYLSKVGKDQIYLEKNNYYYSSSSVYFDKVHYDIISTESEAEKGFIDGTYHDIWPFRVRNLPPSMAEDVIEIPTFTAFSWYILFILNLNNYT